MLKYDREKDQNGNYTYGKYGISNLSKAQDKLIDGLAEYGARWAKEDGFPEMAEEMEKRVGISKGIEKIIEPQAPKRSRGYEMELLRSGFRFILAETAERKTESFLFRRRRRDKPKKREVKGFEGWRFPQGNTTPYLDFSLAWQALPIERPFVPEVALRVGACGA